MDAYEDENIKGVKLHSAFSSINKLSIDHVGQQWERDMRVEISEYAASCMENSVFCDSFIELEI